MSLRDRLTHGSATKGIPQLSPLLRQVPTDRLADKTLPNDPLPTLPNRVNTASVVTSTNPESAGAAPSPNDQYNKLKNQLHVRLISSLNMEQTGPLNSERLGRAAHQLLEHIVTNDRLPISQAERDLMVRELLEEILGYGPLEQLLRDPSVSDILVNGPKSVYVERGGKLEKTEVTFRDNDHLMHVIDRIVSAVGRRVDEKNPMVDARMRDGSRFNAIIPPLALDGASMSIRKFRLDAGSLDKLIGWGSLTRPMAQLLEAAVQMRLNIIISGGTGAGKTTLLNSLSALIPDDERIVTIEDSAELQLQQDHVVRLETRPANIEGEGAITARQLLINSLRMRPDRIVIGECRGGEALDMLQAMNTGHDGSLTTLHANTPRDALSRIETMCMMNTNPLPEKTIRQQIASAVHLVVQASRLQDGSRKVTSISEVCGMEGDVITLQEIFRFKQVGVDEFRKVMGHHESTGIRPRFAEKAQALGIPLPTEVFAEGQAATATAATASSSSSGRHNDLMQTSGTIFAPLDARRSGGRSPFQSSANYRLL